ncbi:MAG: hypothetical protein HWQ35_04645 [Nostoc sp. NMS1]|uniref:hypothetical protein n=1 Tax=unclassified Nostoc TaxID=2593658 RepID=UPI0025D1C18D|nr:MULTISPECIES: hypothetical protein [unclassified Nostoc]MBN3905884.1 hypothetical protein [Nostoc sp. NMS1]MBN3989302.1 hypothetical protein [Nostoc sp. NMS2]
MMTHSDLGDTQAQAQFELEQYINEQVEDIAPEFEIDSVDDCDFGVLYRVWSGMRLIGTFYRAVDGLWVAQPCNFEQHPRCDSSEIAQLMIIALSGLLVAEAA